MKQIILLMITSMGFGAAAVILLTKPPVIMYFLGKLLLLAR